MNHRGNFSSAKLLLSDRLTQSVLGLLHPGDRTNWYRFRLKSSSQLDLHLAGFLADGSVTLFDRNRQVIERLSLRLSGKRSRRSAQQQAAISETLEAGTFFVRVAASRGSQTTYRLKLSVAKVPAQVQPALPATGIPTQPDLPPNKGAIVAPPQLDPPLNDGLIVAPTLPAPPLNDGSIVPPAQPPVLPPTVSLQRNEGLNTIRGNRLRITDTLLQATSSQQSDANQLVYTLTRSPETAVLKLNGQPLNLGDRFTQQDIFNGTLEYRSTVQNADLTEVFRSSTAQLIYPRGIFNASVVFAVEEYDPLRNTTDVDVFLHDGRTAAKIADNVLSEAGKAEGLGSWINVQDISESAVLFGAEHSGILQDLFLYSNGTLRKLADDIYAYPSWSLPRGAKLVDFNAVWTQQQVIEENGRRIRDDRIYATNLITGITSELARQSQLNRFAGFTDCGLVWTGTGGADGGLDSEVFLFDLRTEQTQQLTQNSANDINVRISRSLITWKVEQSGDPLMLYDGSTIRTIPTPPSDRNVVLGVSETQIIWSADTLSPARIDYYSYDIATQQVTLLPTRSADGSLRLSSPVVADSNIFWREIRPNGEIFFYLGATEQLLQVTDERTASDRLSSVNRTGAFVNSGSGNDRQIYFFDSQTQELIRVSEPNTNAALLNAGNNLIWGGQQPPILGFSSRLDPEVATWLSQNPPSTSGYNRRTMLYHLQTRSSMQLTSDQSLTNITGNSVAFNTTNLKANSQAGEPPIQEQVLYLYRAPEFKRPRSMMQDSFGFSVTDGVGGAIDGSFTLHTH